MSMALARYVEGSNIPRSEKKSIMRRMYEGTLGAMGSRGHSGRMAVKTVEVVASGAESLVGGAALGVVHASVGLDIKGKVPADLLLGAVGLATSVATAGDEMSDHAHTMGNLGIGIFGFRQGYAFAAEKKLASGGTPKGFTPITKALMHGDDFGADEYGSEDPVLACASEL